ncbi:MAG: PKD domain-containing protein [Euryarchaeota archaeon]|nr:PKD domain-containing protein [Euryarchaeota archaeon]
MTPQVPLASSLGESTLVLANNSQLPGNFLSTNGATPVAAAVDLADGKVFVAGYWSNSIVELSTSTYQVVGYLPGFLNPMGLVYDSADGNLYVASGSSPTDYSISAVQASTGTLLASAQVPGNYGVLAVDPVHGTVFALTSYVSSYGVWAFTTPTLAHVATVSLPGSPWLITMGPSDHSVLVVEGSTVLTVVNSTTYAVTSTYTVPGSPVDMAIDPVDGTLDMIGWSSSGGENFTALSDTTFQVLTSFSIPELAWRMAVDPSSGDVFVGTVDGPGVVPNLRGNVSVFAPFSHALRANVQVGVSPWGLAYNPRGTVLVSDERSGDVTFLNATTYGILAAVPVGIDPTAIAVAGKSEVFVAEASTNVVAVINQASGKVFATIPVGGYPRAVCYDAGTGEVYVANSETNNISVISATTNTVVATISLSGTPLGLAYDATDSLVWVAQSSVGLVGAISDRSHLVVGELSVGVEPMALLYDAAHGSVVVASPLTDQVVFLRGPGHGTLTSIPVRGLSPDALALDASDGRLFVANLYSDNVSVLDSGTGAYLGAVALPTGGEPGSLDDLATGDEIAVGDMTNNQVELFSASSLSALTRFPVGLHPEAVADNGSTVLVANYGSGSITTLTPPSSAVLDVSVVPGSWLCNSFVIDGATVWSGSTVPLTVGNHSAFATAYCGGSRAFQGWSSSGGVNVIGSGSVVTVRVLANGTLTAIYALSVAAFQVRVTVEPSFCGPVDWGSLVEVNGSTFNEWRGNYSIGAGSCPGYTFSDWSTVGSLVIGSPFLASTTAMLSGTGINATLSAWFGLTSTPLRLTASANPTSGSAPLTVSFQGYASGGVPPYIYNWSFGDGTNNSAPDPVHVYNFAGTYDARLEVVDSASSSVLTALLISVSNPGPLTLSIHAQPATLPLGQGTTIYSSVSGGQGPYYFDWTQLPPGCQNNYAAYLSCTPSAAGTFPITLRVNDQTGSLVYANTQIVVTSPNPTPTTSPGVVWVPAGLVSMAIAAIIVWVVLLLRRPSRPFEGRPSFASEEVGAQGPMGPPQPTEAAWRGFP